MEFTLTLQPSFLISIVGGYLGIKQAVFRPSKAVNVSAMIGKVIVLFSVFLVTFTVLMAGVFYGVLRADLMALSFLERFGYKDLSLQDGLVQNFGVVATVIIGIICAQIYFYMKTIYYENGIESDTKYIFGRTCVLMLIWALLFGISGN